MKRKLSASSSMIHAKRECKEPQRQPQRVGNDEFSALASELKDMIYEPLLVASTPIVFYIPERISLYFPNHYGTPFDDLGCGLHPAIIRVSHGLKDGAARTLYSKNEFMFNQRKWDSRLDHCGTSLILLFLKEIGTNANFIRHIEIPCPEFCYIQAGDSAPEPSDLDDEILECLRSLWSPSPVFPTALTLNFSGSRAAELDQALIIILSNEAWWTKLYNGRGNVECDVRLGPAPGPARWPNYGALVLKFPRVAELPVPQNGFQGLRDQ